MYCYIFGAMPVDDFPFNPTENDLVIAADAGINNTKKFNITPDYIVGDFDSLGYIPTSNNTIVYPVEKDDTDTILAVKLALEKGCKSFRIFGCIGGRLDHTFANIQTCDFIRENGGNAVFFGNDENFCILKNNKITFSERSSGNISVFALENSSGVTIKNLYYEMNKGELTPDYPLATSNKFISAKSTISVENGKLLVIWEKNNIEYTIGGKNE